MKFDRKRFWDAYRENFGSATQSQVDAIEFLLGQFEQTSWNVPQIAYAFATIKHETGDTFEPIHEKGGKAYFTRKYWTNVDVRRELGNKSQADASDFHGRGYVQLTGRRNYEHYGIADDPDRALEREKAFEILTDGMSRGVFTGKKLGDYVNGSRADYRNARRVINGKDKADLIAGYAEDFEDALTVSQVSAADASKPDPNGDSPQDKAVPPTSQDTPAGPDDNSPQPAQPPATPSDAVAVQTVAAEPEAKEDVDAKLTKWSTRYALIPSGIFTGAMSFLAWLKNSPAHLVGTIIIVFGSIVIVYIAADKVVKFLRDRHAENLKDEREKRAHEIQLALIAAASNKDRNTVTLVPPPPVTELPNSDAEGAAA